MEEIVELVDHVLHHADNGNELTIVRQKVNALMAEYPLFAY
jgi:glycine hydroxymethyltransferase